MSRTLVLWIVLASIAARTAEAADVAMTSDRIVGPIGLSMSEFHDSTAALSASEVLQHGRFRECGQEIPRYSPSKSAHWLRFSVQNRSLEPSLSIAIPYAAIDLVEVFLVREHGADMVGRSGLATLEGANQRQVGEYVFELPIAPGQHGEVLLQLRGFKPIHAPVLVASRAELIEAATGRTIAVGAYLGIMLVLALYNLFVFVSTKDRNYFFYVLSTLAVCAAQLSLQGRGPFDEYWRSEWLTPRSSLLFSLVAIPLGFEFARRFIDTRSYTPFLHRITPAVYVLIAGIAMLFMFGDASIGYNLGQAFSGLSAMLLLSMLIVAVRRGSRQARFFLLAWTGFLCGIVLFVLKDEGVLPYNALTIYAMPVGSMIEGVLLSFGLADRINILRKEKERSQAEALASAQENARMVRDQNLILEQRVTERTHQLQESLDHLKRTQSQLVEAEKMSSLGQLTAGIAHEINNPINYIRSNIPPLKRDMDDLLELLAAYRAQGTTKDIAELEQRLGVDEIVTEVAQILHSMEEGATRSAEIVRGLRTFSRLDEGDLKHVDLNEGVISTLNLLNTEIKDRISVELDLRANENVECLPGKMNQVFMNVLNNAVQAVVARHGERGGRISVVTAQFPEHVTVTITDNGTGMTEETRARVFEPFFTTKDVGEGTGLGLSIAHSIIEKHHGRIEVDSIPGQGSEFRIILPNDQPAKAAKRA